MIRDVSVFDGKVFDVAIVGGGITGAFLALDAAWRGLSVALVEKNDFGAATSSASSKLLHGGIRYLQQGRFFKVRESAMERTYFQLLAPHLTKWIPFVIPTYNSFKKGRFLLRSGVMVYNGACLGQNRILKDSAKQVPPGKWLDRSQIEEIVPDMNISGMTGGVLFFESHMHNSERMTLAVMDSAAQAGACVANYLKAQSYIVHNNRVEGLLAHDMETGSDLEIRASLILNASGPWIPELNASLPGIDQKQVVKAYSKGVHLVTRPLTKGHAIALTTGKKNKGLLNRGGRHVFIIPWRGCSLVGTSYGPFEEGLDSIKPCLKDVKELMADINSALGFEAIELSDVRTAFAGLYPLVDEHINPLIYQGTGDYQIIDHKQQNGIDGVITVLGAKYTTARLLAEKAVNLVAGRLQRKLEPCRTRCSTLSSGEISDLSELRDDLSQTFAGIVPAVALENLITNYGVNARTLLEMILDRPNLSEPLSQMGDVLVAQIEYAVRFEQACHLEDVVFRRTGLGTLGHPGTDALEKAAGIMGNILNWSDETIKNEICRAEAKFIFKENFRNNLNGSEVLN